MQNTITHLHNITPQQLGDLISESVKFQLEELKENLKQKESEEYLTRNEVATMLKIDLSTVQLDPFREVKKSRFRRKGLFQAERDRRGIN